MKRKRTGSYGVIRLNDTSDNSWAVVESPSGAIAIDADDHLIMKLVESEARRLAAAMTLVLQQGAEASAAVAA